MTVFEFVDELPATKLSPRAQMQQILVEFAEALKANPGQWAKYPKPLKPAAAATTAGHIKKCRLGVAKAFEAGGFDAACRDGVLYVRFVGQS